MMHATHAGPAGPRDRPTFGPTSAAPRMVPRQHGAWAMLLSGLVLGTAVADGWRLDALLLLGALVAAFWARHAAGLFLRLPSGDGRRQKALAWSLAAAAVFVAIGLFLSTAGGCRALPAFAVVAAVPAVVSLLIERRRQEFSVVGELVGVAGLSLAVPAAEYVGAGAFTDRTVGLWLLAVAFFVGGVLHVRYLVRRRLDGMGAAGARWRAGWPSAVYHIAVMAGAAALGPAGGGLLPGAAPLALLPATARAVWAVARRRPAPLPVRQIGRRELAQGLLFVALAIAAYRMPGAGPHPGLRRLMTWDG